MDHCENTVKPFLPEKKSVVDLNGLCLNVHGGELSPPHMIKLCLSLMSCM